MTASDTKNVCVYCASSARIDSSFLSEARALGKLLAQAGFGLVYGGGGGGSMGAVADGALEAGGRVVGVIPKFMVELEWAHQGLSELAIVDDMHQRKAQMLERSDAAVALPGGSGTYEELLEALTWKRLGLYSGPIIIVDQQGFYRPLIEQMEKAVEQRFLDTRHLSMWTVVSGAEGVVDAIAASPTWDVAEAVSFAVQR